MKIAFTGPRDLSRKEEKRIYRQIALNKLRGEWHFGDADGLDSFIRRAANYYQMHSIIHCVEGEEKWQFAKRSKEMVDAIAPVGILFAFPNKSCPIGCTPNNPFSGHGSGTWGTIAYAKTKVARIDLYPLCPIDMPEWLTQTQMSLF